jgi:hypothetical protein
MEKMELPEDRPEGNDDDEEAAAAPEGKDDDEEAAAARSLAQAISTALNDMDIEHETSPHPSLGEPNQVFRFGIQTESGNYGIRMEARPSTFLLLYTSPLNIPTDRRAAVAEYICRVNYTLLQGCLQMDMRDGEVQYRIAQRNAGMTAPAVAIMFRIAVQMMNTYFPGIMAVTYTGRSPEQAYHDCEPSAMREEQENWRRSEQ